MSLVQYLCKHRPDTRLLGKGDPPSSSASAKDKQKDQVQDALINGPPKLPEWLEEHDRRASRVDVDVRMCDLALLCLINVPLVTIYEYSYRFRLVLIVYTRELYAVCH